LNEMTSPLYGADAHVDKPFELTDLDDCIEETLANRREGAFGRADGADEEMGSVEQDDEEEEEDDEDDSEEYDGEDEADLEDVAPRAEREWPKGPRDAVTEGPAASGSKATTKAGRRAPSTSSERATTAKKAVTKAKATKKASSKTP